MTAYSQLIAKSCVGILEKKNIEHTEVKVQFSKDDKSLVIVSFNILVTMNTIGMLIGKDPLGIKLSGGLLIPNISINVNLNSDTVLINSDILSTPKIVRGPFEIFNIINNHNINSANNKAFLIPKGVQFTSGYNLNTVDYNQEKKTAYNIDFISILITQIIEDMIRDIYAFFLEMETL